MLRVAGVARVIDASVVRGAEEAGDAPAGLVGRAGASEGVPVVASGALGESAVALAAATDADAVLAAGLRIAGVGGIVDAQIALGVTAEGFNAFAR